MRGPKGRRLGSASRISWMRLPTVSSTIRPATRLPRGINTTYLRDCSNMGLAGLSWFYYSPNVNEAARMELLLGQA